MEELASKCSSFTNQILRIPPCHNYLKIKVDKFRLRVEGWMTKLLPFVSRIELVESVFLNFLSYWFHSFKLPSLALLLER